jgi:hypothetical protein
MTPLTLSAFCVEPAGEAGIGGGIVRFVRTSEGRSADD